MMTINYVDEYIELSVNLAELTIIKRALYEYRQDKGYKYHDYIEKMENEILQNEELNEHPEDLNPEVLL